MKQEPIIIRRLRNFAKNVGTADEPKADPNFGNWDKIEDLTKKILVQSKAIESLARDFVKADTRLKDLMREAYQITPETDCLFYDSPMSPARQTRALKVYMKKLGWDGIKDSFLFDITKAEDFSKAIKDACAWLVKFKPEKTV